MYGSTASCQQTYDIPSRVTIFTFVEQKLFAIHNSQEEKERGHSIKQIGKQSSDLHIVLDAKSVYNFALLY